MSIAVQSATRLTPRTSAHLDLIRGLAAILVLAGHVRGLFFVEHGNLRVTSLLIDSVYAVTGLGHQAVMVFFVLSGFFIGGTVLKGVQRWSWQQYIVSRLSRLYLVLLPALVLAAVADYAGHRLPAGPVYYDQAIPHFSGEPFSAASTPTAFAGNILFLQNIAVRPFGSNSPLWSLANEFWYYVLFPLVALLVFGRGTFGRKMAYGLIASVLLVWLPKGMLFGFVVWLSGAVIHFLPDLAIPSRPAFRFILKVGFAVPFCCVLLISRGQRIPEDWNDLAVGLSFAVWLYFLVKVRGGGEVTSRGYAASSGFLSKCSYSVYAVHFPVLLLVRTLAGTSLWAPTFWNLTLAGGITLGLFGCGHLFSRVTEAHTGSVREWLIRVMSFKTARQVAPDMVKM